MKHHKKGKMAIMTVLNDVEIIILSANKTTVAMDKLQCTMYFSNLVRIPGDNIEMLIFYVQTT